MSTLVEITSKIALATFVLILMGGALPNLFGAILNHYHKLVTENQLLVT